MKWDTIVEMAKFLHLKFNNTMTNYSTDETFPIDELVESELRKYFSKDLTDYVLPKYFKRLPIGIQTFGKLIKENYLYIDKTKQIYNLFTESGQYYFLSRPRRFGKSLLISTLKEIFLGNKTLFKGLWIYDKIGWEKHPVIHLDFSKISYENGDQLKSSLVPQFDKIATNHNITLAPQSDFKAKLNDLIEALSMEAQVVFLVDEYDKPLIDFVDRAEIAIENREILKNLYDAVKSADEHLEFVFITGVSKFSKVSVFSGFNNLRDITLSTSFSTLLGYTQEEFLKYFGERIDWMPYEDKNMLLTNIRNWYNGYSWDGQHFVYNPFSILNFFQEKRFDNYWFSTGTPTFLIKSIKKDNIDIRCFENYETTDLLFDSFEIDQITSFPLLFQTGYLTLKEIKEISSIQSIYRLSYPNNEVKKSFLDYLVADYTGRPPDEMSYLVYKLQEAVTRTDIDEFFKLIKSVFASVPSNVNKFIRKREAYYHTVIYLLLKLLGIHINVEVETNIGRIDGVLETDDYIFIMEFKVGKALEALEQIKEKKYYEKYLPTPKIIKIIGVGFDTKDRNIKEFLVEDIPA